MTPVHFSQFLLFHDNQVDGTRAFMVQVDGAIARAICLAFVAHDTEIVTLKLKKLGHLLPYNYLDATFLRCVGGSKVIVPYSKKYYFLNNIFNQFLEISVVLVP